MAILYYYICTDCGYEFEDFYSIKDRDLPVECLCPNCGNRGTVERIIGTTAKAVWLCSKPTNS